MSLLFEHLLVALCTVTMSCRTRTRAVKSPRMGLGEKTILGAGWSWSAKAQLVGHAHADGSACPTKSIISYLLLFMQMEMECTVISASSSWARIIMYQISGSMTAEASESLTKAQSSSEKAALGERPVQPLLS